MLFISGQDEVPDETQVSESLLLISALPASQLLPPQAIISCSISWGVYSRNLGFVCPTKGKNLQSPSSFPLSCYVSFLLLQLFLILLFDLQPFLCLLSEDYCCFCQFSQFEFKFLLYWSEFLVKDQFLSQFRDLTFIF